MYRFLVDPGHAWLEVPTCEVKASTCPISTYSYISQDGLTCYLEEDCDAPSFAFTRMGPDETMGAWWRRNAVEHMLKYDFAAFFSKPLRKLDPVRELGRDHPATSADWVAHFNPSGRLDAPGRSAAVLAVSVLTPATCEGICVSCGGPCDGEPGGYRCPVCESGDRVQP